MDWRLRPWNKRGNGSRKTRPYLMNLPNYLRKKRGLLQIRRDGEWDVWNPYHSKLSAYLVAGGKNWPFKKNSKNSSYLT